MRSKAIDRFKNRAARFSVDLELIDVLDITTKTNFNVLFASALPAKHPGLARQVRTAKNQQLLFSHIKATLRAAYIKDLYEDFSAYLAEIVTGAARNGLEPGRLVGEHKFDISANDILACTSLDEVVSLVATRLFRKLEDERSTYKLVESISKKLGLQVAQAKIDAALPFLDLRHVLVHRDGCPDEQFCSKYPSFGGVPGDKLRITHQITTTARQAITELVDEYDTCVLRKHLLGANDIAT